MPDPITRQETYLNAIAQNTGGGSAGSVPEPITREEQFLNQIATNTAGGGGGGASLPAVTADDNGDVLTVVEGAWAKAAPSGGGGGVLVVMFEQGNNDVWTMDKTRAEILAALEAGVFCVGNVQGCIGLLQKDEDLPEIYTFVYVVNSDVSGDGILENYYIEIAEDGTLSADVNRYRLPAYE